MSFKNLPMDLIGKDIADQLDSTSLISLVDAFPAMKDIVSWNRINIHASCFDDLLRTLLLMEKYIISGKHMVQEVFITCRWEMTTPRIAASAMSALCRMMILHSKTIGEISMDFVHMEGVLADPKAVFEHCQTMATHLFVQCMNMPRIHRLHLAGLGISANASTFASASPSSQFFACVDFNGLYLLGKERWACLYMDDEEGLAFLEISNPKTVCDHHIRILTARPEHVTTYVGDGGEWTGGMRFVPGNMIFFAFPMVVSQYVLV